MASLLSLIFGGIMGYLADQWVFFFFCYSFCGWIWECCYVSIRTKKLTNRGFVRGPVLPIYGSGAVLMVAVGLPLMDHPVIMFFAGMICASILEYFTGDVMYKLFKVRYWDYSECFLNVNGHICLKASICWGFFTLGTNYYLHKPVEKLVLNIPGNWLDIIVMLMVIAFVADYSLAFRAALDLRDVIIAYEQFKEELERMEKRMDVAIAFAEDDKNRAKLMLTERLEAMENKFEEALSANISPETKEKLVEQINEYKKKSMLMKARLDELNKKRNAMMRNMIRNNPLSSEKFAEALEEIKKRATEYSRKINE